MSPLDDSYNSYGTEIYYKHCLNFFGVGGTEIIASDESIADFVCRGGPVWSPVHDTYQEDTACARTNGKRSVSWQRLILSNELYQLYASIHS